MACVILINGLPGSGKSTLARRYVDSHPLSVALDLDLVRSMIGAWRERPEAAGVLARRMAIAAIPEVIRAGNDVVVPQLLGRVEFIEDLDATARSLGVPFVEVLLTVPDATAAQRLRQRAATSPTNTESADPDEDAARLVATYGTALADVVERRPWTVPIASDDEADPLPPLVAEVAHARSRHR
ncbi:AAA family ATPase [Microbacterium ureisolvens]|uniref:ATP-binding protein n=1 Tax=Microbacterium TaxID=33882 RepID=UPI000D6513F7|nr:MULTISPECIES: ATP-binding protein [Microbacterium]